MTIENRDIHSYNCDVWINHEDRLYEINIADWLEISWERKGVAGKCTFSIVQEEASKIEFEEGDHVRVRISKTWMFYGFIFTKTRSSDGAVKVTCYDQLRYLKAKESVVFVNKTVGEIVKMICNDRHLKTGIIRDSKYKIPTLVKENGTYLDIICQAIEMTTQATGEIFIFYDRFGKLTLCPLKHMNRNVIIDGTVIEDFDYESTIDKNTYNLIRVGYKSQVDGATVYQTYPDKNNIAKWGTLQYTAEADSPFQAPTVGVQLLKFYNSKTKTLKIKKAMGANEVVAGSIVMVNLDLGDMKINNNMVVDAVTHRIEDGLYSMDLELIGGEFVSTRGVQGESGSERKPGDVIGGASGRVPGGNNPLPSYSGGGITYRGRTLSESLVNAIITQCRRYSIMPSFILAQMWAESSWGNSNVGRKNNNWSGITWPYKGDPSVKKYKGSARPSREGGNYVKWDSVEDFIVDYFYLFREGGIYKVRHKTSINGYINGLLTKSRGGEAKANYAASGGYRGLMTSTYNAMKGNIGGKLSELDALVYKNGEWLSESNRSSNNSSMGSSYSSLSGGYPPHVEEARRHIGKSWEQMKKVSHMTRYYWCADFTMYCMSKLPNHGFRKTSSTRDLFDQFHKKSRGKYDGQARGYKPKPGDIIFFNNGSSRASGPWKIDHVGIVENCDGSKVTTIEGNSGSRLNVGRHVYSINARKINGYGII